MAKLRHVALLIETSREYGRGVLRGIAQYHRTHAHWLTRFEPHGLGEPPPKWLSGWSGDGVVARVDSRRMASVLMELGAPVVNLRSGVSNLPFPFLGTDNEEVARMAAEHLLDRGLAHFAYCDWTGSGHPGLERRLTLFARRIEQAGFACSSFEAGAAEGGRRLTDEQKNKRLIAFLESLPKPVGIMAANDDCGMRVLEGCRELGLTVPDEVAVIGVDNDEHLCNLSIPPLSSIELNTERIGFEAAALLDRLMAGRAAPRKPHKIKPLRVIARESTDVLATSDREVVQAIRFIRERACERLQAADVFTHVGASRASLEPRLRAVLRRSVHQEIHRIRLERAKDLLSRTSVPIKQVALQSGFSNVQYLTRVFHQATGQTPAAFRQQASL